MRRSEAQLVPIYSVFGRVRRRQNRTEYALTRLLIKF